MTHCIGQSLEGFQHSVAQRITGRQPRQLLDGSWGCPLLGAVMQEAWFEDMEEYVLKRQNMVAQYIAMRPIMDLCKETVWMPGTWVGKS